jgi:two-component system chemotaxis response regulator CheY
MSKRILSIGQCFADHGAISRMFQGHFGAEVTPADSASEALALLRRERFDLVLVNRILDADGSSGLDIIRDVKADAALQAVPVMLVSNYDDAQRQAVAAGAAPGFGKAALSQPQTLARLRNLLGGA